MIRRAELGDLGAIVEIGSRAFPYIKNPQDFFLRRLKEGHVFVWEEGEVTGFIDLSIDGDVLRIEGIAVKQGARGRGIGKRLLSFALSFGKTLGLRRAWLMTLSSNGRALRLYTKLGFRPLRREGEVLYLTRLL